MNKTTEGLTWQPDPNLSAEVRLARLGPVTAEVGEGFERRWYWIVEAEVPAAGGCPACWLEIGSAEAVGTEAAARGMAEAVVRRVMGWLVGEEGGGE